jgi:hypothetical protein
MLTGTIVVTAISQAELIDAIAEIKVLLLRGKVSGKGKHLVDGSEVNSYEFSVKGQGEPD